MEKDLRDYVAFVDAVTSEESKDFRFFIDRLVDMQEMGVDVPRLLTGGIGLSSETGEFNEIVKKMTFQGKPVNEENIFHMKRELGDIMWYWAQCCMALGLNPYEVIDENINKLQSRYPAGKFNAWFSENREKGDL